MFSSIWRKLHFTAADKESCEVSSESDDHSESNGQPVIQFYLLAYGISLIICGINVAVSHEQYMTDNL